MRTLVCVDVSQEVALRGVLPWLICIGVAVGLARGSITIESGAVLTLLGLALQASARRRDRGDGDDAR